VIETRVISVLSHYYLSFFAVSIAMLGMTVGSLIVFYNRAFFTSERIFPNLAWLASAFAVAIVFSTLILVTSVLLPATNGFFISATQWLKLIAALLPPYILAGMAISIALTKSPWRIGLVYGSDLAGAAMGCLSALALMNSIDGVSALLVVAAVAAFAG